MRRIQGLIFLLLLVHIPDEDARADVADDLHKILPFIPAESANDSSILESENRRLLAKDYLAEPKKVPDPWKSFREFEARTLGMLLHVPIPYTRFRVGDILDEGGLIDGKGKKGECHPIRLIERGVVYDQFGQKLGESFKVKPRIQAPIPLLGTCAVFGVKMIRSVQVNTDGTEGKKKTTGAQLTIRWEF